MRRLPESERECCPCHKLDDEKDYYIFGCAHDLISDHEPVAWCEHCNIAISEGFVDVHKQFKCNNEKVGAYLKRQHRA